MTGAGMQGRGDDGRTLPAGAPANAARTVLVVGDHPPTPLRAGALVPGRIVAVTFGQLDAALLARVLPDCVLTGLVAEGFDAMDVAERLQALGYGGEVWVVCPPLPDLPLVRRELTAAFPGLTVRFIGEAEGPG